MINVIKLAHHGTPAKRVCTSCIHCRPDTHMYGGWEYSRGWLLWLVGVGKRRPSATAIKFASCSALGGYFTTVAWPGCVGDYWEPQQ